MYQSRRKGSDANSIPLKACLFALESVSKQELIEKYMIQDKVKDKIGMMGFIVKTIQYKSQSIKLNIWDCATQERYLHSSGHILRDCDIIMCLFDYTNPDSLAFLKEKYTFLKINAKSNAVFGLIGLNYQLDSKVKDLHEEVTAFAAMLKAYFVATNFMLEMNVKEAFEKGIDLVISMRDIEEQQEANGFRIQKQDNDIDTNDIEEVKRSLEANLSDLTNGLFGKVFGGDKEKINLCTKNLNIIKSYEKSHELILSLKEKNETLEKAITNQFLQKNTDNIHKTEMAELEKRLNDTTLHYIRHIENLDFELRSSKTQCISLKEEVAMLEQKNVAATEGFKTVLQTYRAQNKEKFEAKEKIIQELSIEKEKLTQEITELKNENSDERNHYRNDSDKELNEQTKLRREAEFLKAELAKKEIEIQEMRRLLQDKVKNETEI